jgi:hypothetical protein
MPMPLSLMVEGPGGGVDRQVDLQLRVVGQLGAGDLLEPALVEGVGGVGDQLAEEDVLVGVERVDHQVEELLHLGLEFVTFGALGHGAVSIVSPRPPRKPPGRQSVAVFASHRSAAWLGWV